MVKQEVDPAGQLHVEVGRERVGGVEPRGVHLDARAEVAEEVERAAAGKAKTFAVSHAGGGVHNPEEILISAVAEGPWAVEDCSLAAENLMLAAYAAGLGTCWIGFAQSFLNTPAGKNMLGLPAAWVSVAPVIVGHPKAAPPPVPRKKPELRWIG